MQSGGGGGDGGPAAANLVVGAQGQAGTSPRPEHRRFAVQHARGTGTALPWAIRCIVQSADGARAAALPLRTPSAGTLPRLRVKGPGPWGRTCRRLWAG